MPAPLLLTRRRLQMLEICEPHELDRIRTIYCRDGFGAPTVFCRSV